MADFNYLIPRQQQQQQIDLPGALLKGFAGPLALSGQITQNQLAQEKLKQFQDTRNALAQFAKTQNPMDIMATDPEKAVAIQKMTEARRESALEYAYTMADQVKARPEIYPAVRQRAIQMGIDETAIPAEYSPEFVDNFKKSYERIKKLGSDMVPLYDAAGKFQQMVPKESKIGMASAMPITVYNPRDMQPMGTMPPHSQFAPSQKEGPVPQYFENPETGESAWVVPGEVIPPGFKPKSQVVALGKETEKQEDKGVLAEMLVNGEMTPATLSKRGDYNSIIALAKKKDPNFSPAQLSLKWEGAKKWVSSLNSSQQGNMEKAGMRVIETVDEVKKLASQMKLSGFNPGNYAEIEAKMKLAGNTKAGQLATQYITAVNDLKEVFVNAVNNGYAPTDSAWKLVDKQINSNYGVDQMHASLDEVKRLMHININAGKEMREQAGVWNPGGNKQSGASESVNLGKYQKTVPTPSGGIATLVGEKDGNPLYKWPDGTIRPRIQKR